MFKESELASFDGLTRQAVISSEAWCVTPDLRIDIKFKPPSINPRSFVVPALICSLDAFAIAAGHAQQGEPIGNQMLAIPGFRILSAGTIGFIYGLWNYRHVMDQNLGAGLALAVVDSTIDALSFEVGLEVLGGTDIEPGWKMIAFGGQVPRRIIRTVLKPFGFV